MLLHRHTGECNTAKTEPCSKWWNFILWLVIFCVKKPQYSLSSYLVGYTDYEWAFHSSIINHIHVTNNFVGKLVLYALKFLEIPLLSTFNRTHSQNNSAVFHAHTGIELWFRGKFTTETRFSVLSSPFIGFQLFSIGKRKWTVEYIKMKVISFSLVALSAHLHSLALLLA